MNNAIDLINQIQDRGFEFVQRIRGQSGKCLFIVSKRFDHDRGDKRCRWFIALTDKLWDEPTINFRFCVTRTALGAARVKELSGNAEDFLLEAGLLRFKRLLRTNDTPGASSEFLIHSRSPEADFEMEDPEELQKEIDRTKYELLDILWRNRYKGIKRTQKQFIEDKICTNKAILDSVLNYYEHKNYINGALGSSGIKITPDGEEELDKMRSAEKSAEKIKSKIVEMKPPEYDVFICHASEDKDSFVRSLAEGLRSKGLRVWYDEFTLRIGDSLRDSIDKGLLHSSHGVVVISNNFFKKKWPQSELNGLFSKIESDKKVILPVWHNITADEIKAISPLLADLVAAKSADGLDSVISSIIEAL